jgi:hypothetical protein
MKEADRARYKQLRSERKELQERIVKIEAAVLRVDDLTKCVCDSRTGCEGCPCENMCIVADKAYAKAHELRKRLSAVHKELSVIFSVKEGK